MCALCVQVLRYRVIFRTMNRFLNYLRDSRGELKHVSWPTQQQTIIYTTIVIVLSILTGVYLGLLDFLFAEGLSLFVF